jgi:hypothetical protein
MIETFVSIFGLIIVIIAFFFTIFSLNSAVNFRIERMIRKRFSHQLLLILESDITFESKKMEIVNYFYKLREKFPDSSYYLKSISYLIEDILYYLDQAKYENKRATKQLLMHEENVNLLFDERPEIINLLHSFKSEDEELLESISPKTATLFKEIKVALQQNNQILGSTSLNKLITEFNDVENQYLNEKKKSNRLANISLVLTVIGLILSTIPFF